MRNYTRWRRGPHGVLTADMLGFPAELVLRVNPNTQQVDLGGRYLTPDEARMLGVRLVDAAVLADGDAAVREQYENE
jgi:hypothetical protein